MPLEGAFSTVPEMTGQSKTRQTHVSKLDAHTDVNARDHLSISNAEKPSII